MTDIVPEVVVPTHETKHETKPERQKPDMTKVREGKKRKQQERDSMLSDLSKQVSVIGTTLKPETDEEEDGPVVVTKQKKQKTDDGPSFKNELCKAVAVGVLGLATWYVQSVAFKKPETSMLDRIQPLPLPTPIVPVTPSVPQSTMPPPAPKKKVGASGLLE
jgi:hypothetical protein